MTQNSSPRSSPWGSGLDQLWALLRLRCPRCHQGKVFRGSVAMNDPCPVCGLIFEREEGYFLGAMYVSYGIGSVLIIPIFYLVQWLCPGWSPAGLFGLTMLFYLPLVPAIFRYSRVVWIHFDRLSSHGDTSASGYEKLRRRELDRAREKGAIKG